MSPVGGAKHYFTSPFHSLSAFCAPGLFHSSFSALLRRDAVWPPGGAGESEMTARCPLYYIPQCVCVYGVREIPGAERKKDRGNGEWACKGIGVCGFSNVCVQCGFFCEGDGGCESSVCV